MSVKSTEIFYIYALSDPRSGAIRYIGKANCPFQRLKSHKSDAKFRNRPVQQWIRELAEIGLEPRLTVLRATSDWKLAECEEVAKAKKAGFDLLNRTNGGNAPAPIYDRIWYLKRAMGQMLRNGHVSERSRAKLRLAAQKRPDLFGMFLNV